MTGEVLLTAVRALGVVLIVIGVSMAIGVCASGVHLGIEEMIAQRGREWLVSAVVSLAGSLLMFITME